MIIWFGKKKMFAKANLAARLISDTTLMQWEMSAAVSVSMTSTVVRSSTGVFGGIMNNNDSELRPALCANTAAVRIEFVRSLKYYQRS